MNNYLVSQELLQTILNYLATRPYNEVHALVPQIQVLKPVVVETDEEKAQ